MKKNINPCCDCPFTPKTRKATATDELVGVALKRIEGGERWVCHKSTGAGGHVTPKSRYCAAAPKPPRPDAGAKGS